jgi:hypothetical protein
MYGNNQNAGNWNFKYENQTRTYSIYNFTLSTGYTNLIASICSAGDNQLQDFIMVVLVVVHIYKYNFLILLYQIILAKQVNYLLAILIIMVNYQNGETNISFTNWSFENIFVIKVILSGAYGGDVNKSGNYTNYTSTGIPCNAGEEVRGIIMTSLNSIYTITSQGAGTDPTTNTIIPASGQPNAKVFTQLRNTLSIKSKKCNIYVYNLYIYIERKKLS